MFVFILKESDALGEKKNNHRIIWWKNLNGKIKEYQGILYQ